MNQPIIRIVYTGGPCGGKTTALSRTFDHFSKLGYRVVIVPEAATLLINGGFKPTEFPDLAPFQDSILTFILTLETEAKKLAGTFTDKPILMVCDRGAMDGKAYCLKSQWQDLLKRRNFTESELRDQRYDAVIHLVSAADGAPEFYTKDTNSARFEDVELACHVDRKIQDAWTGHSHFRIIDNSTNFEGKIRRTLAAVSNVLGIPEPRKMERKYLLANSPSFPVDLHVDASQITQTHLINAKESERIAARQSGANTIYTYSRKLAVKAGQRIEIERMISNEEYHLLALRRDLTRRPVEKVRHCFVWEKRHYEVDQFLKELEGIHILEAEVDSLEEFVRIPPFLEIKEEVTTDPVWNNSELARLH